jgi:pimeloyl-ACP methyl ester carboxylesterase
VKRILLSGAFFLFATITFAGPQNSMKGDWVGILKLTEKPSPMRLHVIEDGSGFLNLPLEEIVNQPLTQLAATTREIHFEFKKETVSFQFDGNIQQDSIKGKVTLPDRQGTFDLVRIAPVDIEKYFGTYKSSTGNYLYIRTWDELGDHQLTYFDDAGHVGPLFAKSETEFFSGPSILIPVPVAAKIIFELDASHTVKGIQWSETGKEPVEFQRVTEVREEGVTFQNGEVRLSGSLTLPTGDGKFPALVLIHGSGPVTRDFFGPIAYMFARHKIAVLSYDKRGIGKSQGNWMDAGFEDYAADALAGLHYLSQRKEIDSSAIGLWGISQGGWIAPLAASKDSDVAFVMALSAPAVTPAEQEMQRMSEEMKLQGTPEEQIAGAAKQFHEQIEGLRTEEAKKEFESAVAKLRAEGKTELLNQRGLDNPRYLLFYRRILDYDPLPALQNLKCPVLAIYGEVDRTVPVAGNKSILESALEKAGNKNHLILVLPKGDHALMLSKSGSYTEFPYLNQFVPGLFQTMVDWIVTRASRSPESTEH